MTLEKAKIYDKSSESILKGYLSEAGNIVEKTESVGEKIRSIARIAVRALEKNRDSIKILDAVRVYKDMHEQTLEYIKGAYETLPPGSFEKDFDNFSKKTGEYLKTLPDKITEIQTVERYKSQPENAFRIKFLKFFKRIFFFLYSSPVRFANLFRKIFKKETKPIKYWPREVPLKNMTAFHLRERFAEDMLPEVDKILAEVGSACFDYWDVFAGCDERVYRSLLAGDDLEVFCKNAKLPNIDDRFGEIFRSLDVARTNLKVNGGKIFDRNFDKLRDSYEKVGTVELPIRNYSSKKIFKRHKKLKEAYADKIEGRRNNLFAIFDSWSLNEELQILLYSLREEFLLLRDKVGERIDRFVEPKLKEIVAELSRSVEKVTDTPSEKFPDLVKFERDKIIEKISEEAVPKTVELALEQNFPLMIDEIELRIRQASQRLSTKRAVVRSEKFNRSLKKSDIDYLNPREIALFDIFPKFEKAVKKAKHEAVDTLQDLQTSLSAVGEIADYNLESALTLIDNGGPIEEARKSAREGLVRAVARAQESDRKLIELNRIIDGLESAVGDFENSIQELKSIESVFEKKADVAKSKAATRFGKVLSASRRKVAEIAPKAFDRLKTFGKKAKKSYEEIKLKIGFDKSEAGIAVEMSDFLLNSQSALEKLPFSYRRLFQPRPLENERFYEPRIEAPAILNKSLEVWRKGNFAATALAAERGGGVTSIVNLFVKPLEAEFEVISFDIVDRITDMGSLVRFFGEKLNAPDAQNLTEMCDKINSHPKKRIVVVEKIQNLFIRKVGGFECLRALYEIITGTNSNVFWIATASIYSWDYFDRTIDISDFFAATIKLKDLRREQINEIILKRHKVSGYNLKFEPSAKDEQSKKYRRADDRGKQEYLKNEYFTDLRKFARSNISLALLFWTLSTKEVSGDKIVISSLKDLDFSFMENLSGEKIFALHALTIHEKLTAREFSEVFGISLKTSEIRLSGMCDDGIIIQNGGRYEINRALYRQTTELLQKRNLLY